jgi:4-amino-4-deoxy-L-arabinose transferase-like glycosyltransferase
MNSPTEEALATLRRAKPPAEARMPDVLFFPETSRKEWLVTLAIFLVSCAYLCLFRNASPFDPDEGVALQGAERILRGQVVYRDFFSFMTPGSYYWMALLFKVFGNSMLVARTQLVVFGGVFSSLTYLLARRVCARLTSLIAAYLVLITMLPFRFEAIHNWDSTLWAVLALYSAALLLQTQCAVWAFAAGTFTAGTFLFEQSKGGGLLVGLFVAFVCIAFARPESGLRRPRVWATVLGGFLWPFLAAVGYWSHEGAAREMWTDWLWPLRHYTTANAAPYGALFPSYWTWVELFKGASWIGRGIVIVILSPTLVVALLPILALGAFGVCVHEIIRRKYLSEATSYGLLVSAVACGAGLSIVVKRAEFAQFVFVAPLLYQVLALMLEQRTVFRSIPGAGRRRLTQFLLVSFTLFGAMLLKIATGPKVAIQTRRGNLKAASDSSALEYLMANTQGGEDVFVYPYAAHLYFLTDTNSPTRFDYLQPGLHTPEQFEEAVRAVEGSRTALVMYDLGFYTDQVPQSWPFTPPASLADEPLRSLLTSTYRPCAVVGRDRDRFVAFWRKDLPCPPSPAP